MNNPRSSRPLSELVDPERGISYGIVQPGEECIDGIPIIRVTDIREGRISTEAPLRVRSEIESKYVRTRLRGGELLLTLVGTVGETAIVPPELAGWNTARAVGVLPICKEPGARWVHYVLRSRDVQALIREWCNTTVQATLNLRDVARLPIIVPPLQERRAIEEILFALDDKIELNRQISRTLETMVKALFKSWFIDFDPIRAKTDSCGQMDIVAAALALFPSTLCEDHLGLIPKGWQRGTFGDIAEAPRRGVHPADVEPTMAYIGLEHMPRRSIALSEWGRATDVTSGKMRFACGDILFGKLRPYFHKVGVAPLDGLCSTDIIVMTPHASEYFGVVLCHASSDEMIKHTDASSTGTKMPRTNWAELSRFKITIPPVAVARAFSDIVRPWINHIISSIHEARQLARIRDELLPRLLSGSVKMRSIEHKMARGSRQ